MISDNRWQVAQKAEMEFWEHRSLEELREENPPKKAYIFVEEISKFTKMNNNTKILEVGCGGFSLINLLKKGKRHSIDPLADFYKEKYKINYKPVTFVKGVGENLPYPDNYFDVVMCINVLDHTKSPSKVISEMRRVLKKGGMLYFENYYYQSSFLFIFKVYGFFKEMFGSVFNICHPHMLSLTQTRNILKGFKIKKEFLGRSFPHVKNLFDLRRQRMKEGRLVNRMLALFWLIGKINYTSFCQKK